LSVLTVPLPTSAPPLILVESRYDRVTSFLMAVILGAFLVFGWLSIIAATTSAYRTRSSPPVTVIEVSGGGGGTPEGKVAGIEEINVPGGEVADKASNNEEQATEFEAPLVEARPSAMLDSVVDAGETLAEVDVSTVTPSGGKLASGQRRSKVGDGGPGFGFGPGDGGVRREDRWSILYKPGSTADEYARQLDAFKVELAIIEDGHLVYVSNFSDPKPTRRTGSGSDDRRLYFVWRGQGRKESDLALLAKAGLDVGEGVIFQFYPDAVEQALSRLEVKYKGRQPAEIRSTRFGVVNNGSDYDFEVLSQEALR